MNDHDLRTLVEKPPRDDAPVDLRQGVLRRLGSAAVPPRQAAAPKPAWLGAGAALLALVGLALALDWAPLLAAGDAATTTASTDDLGWLVDAGLCLAAVPIAWLLLAQRRNA